VEAAAYLGVSPGKFDEMVADGRMPPPIVIDRRKVWDIRAIDRAIDCLTGEISENEWDIALKKSG
jgi:predicted DNA-binding transcriptional regulator AlpA